MGIKVNTKNLKEEIKNLNGNLIAVSKNVSEKKIRDAYSSGIQAFGENYVLEACHKIKTLSDLNIQWHYLGRLQSNTLNKVIDKFSLIHTGAKLSHLIKINKNTKNIQKILIQIKHPKDIRNYGVLEDDLELFLSEALKLDKIILSGLMFIPPVDMKEENLSAAFLWAKKHFDRLSLRMDENRQKNWSILSMGMSKDYLNALKNGATHVRLGRIIFGER